MTTGDSVRVQESRWPDTIRAERPVRGARGRTIQQARCGRTGRAGAEPASAEANDVISCRHSTQRLSRDRIAREVP